ncbi:MAG: hypothetical protein H0V09_07430 [Gemmatimonadetes bacterium]|nr:hypothetical protein [Gemmatimonadota bacterium]
MRCLVLAFLGCAVLASSAGAQEGKGSDTPRGPGYVVVVNGLERGVTVWINGELKGHLGPGAEARFDRIPAGPVRLQAGGVGAGGPVASEERTLAPSETFTWRLYPVLAWEEEKGTGTLVVRNASADEVSVYFGDHEAGQLAPGASRAYPRLVVGEVDVSARNARGEIVDEREIAVGRGSVARWEIGRGARGDSQDDPGEAGERTPSGAAPPPAGAPPLSS